MYPYRASFQAQRNRAKERDGYKCQECGESKKRLYAHHIDHDKTNDELSNLTTLCQKCHLKHHPKKSLLSADDVRKIRELRQHGLTHVEIARRFNASYAVIQACATGKTWKHLPNIQPVIAVFSRGQRKRFNVH